MPEQQDHASSNSFNNESSRDGISHPGISGAADSTTMLERIFTDIAIIGAGPAGLTAAIYGTRAGLSTMVLGGPAPGGQLIQTNEIENFPGFPSPITGFDLMTKMIDQAKRLGARLYNEQVSEVVFNCYPFKIFSEEKEFIAKTVIIATGASPRWLSITGEKKFIGRGVSACATCDGFFFRGKDVCVIGGGDTAAGDALFLSKFASRIYLIHRRDRLRAAFILQEKLRSNPKIEIIYDHVPHEVLGEDAVSGIDIRNVKSGEIKRLHVSGIFVAIGHNPNTSLFKGKIHLDDEGYIVVSHAFETSIQGVYAAGDVCDRFYKQGIVAAGSGCMAAINAIKYLEIKG